MKFKEWWSIYGGAVIVCAVALAIIFLLVGLAMIIAYQFAVLAAELADNPAVHSPVFILVSIFLSAAFVIIFIMIIAIVMLDTD